MDRFHEIQSYIVLEGGAEMEEQVNDIVERLKAKDFIGLELLIEHFSFNIISAIHQILNRPEDKALVDDVANETFYKIWKNAQYYSAEKSSFHTWISIIAKRTALDYKKKDIKHQHLIPLEEKQAELAAEENIAFKQENFMTLIDELKEEDQMIFLSYYYYNDAPKEIAENLNLTTEIIYNRLSRGKKKLREQLLKGGKTHDDPEYF